MPGVIDDLVGRIIIPVIRKYPALLFEIVIDFGVAVIRKSGFAPVNRYLYNLALKFDFNAWIKLKYDGRYEDILEQDREYFNRTVIEKVSRLIKDTYLDIKKALKGKR